MTGDLADIVSRLSLVLPKHWFPAQSPNVNAVLTGIAAPWAWLYDLITYVIKQTRIGTATDDWLDLVAFDYFGRRLARKPDELDPSYRSRIKAALLRDGATRTAVSSALQTLTGSRPGIFEPANCMDTGCYGTLTDDGLFGGGGLAYGMTGGWGSLNRPFQFFITASRPPTPGVAMLTGYGSPSGGYGGGFTSYVDLALLPGHVTDIDIESTLTSLLPINAVAWLRII